MNILIPAEETTNLVRPITKGNPAGSSTEKDASGYGKGTVDSIIFHLKSKTKEQAERWLMENNLHYRRQNNRIYVTHVFGTLEMVFKFDQLNIIHFYVR